MSVDAAVDAAAGAWRVLLEALAVIAALIFASTLRGEQAFVLALGLVWVLLWWDREYGRTGSSCLAGSDER